MAGVGGLARLAEDPREGDGQRLSEKQPDPDPQLERHRLAVTQLDPADPGLVDADPVGKLRLGDSQALPAGPDACPERRARSRC